MPRRESYLFLSFFSESETISCWWSAVGQINISFVGISKYSSSTKDFENFYLIARTMATALKHIKSIQWLLNLNYLVRSPASWKKPCLGLRFHSDILNSKCRKIHKTFFILTDSCESFKFIYFTGWATKSDGFFPLLFMQRFVYWLYAVGWFSLFSSWPVLISCISLFLTVWNTLYVSVVNRFSCHL